MTDSFRIRTGRCVVADDSIRFESDGPAGWVGTLLAALTSEEVPTVRQAVIVLVVVVGVGNLALAARVVPSTIAAAVAGLVASVLAWSWWRDRGRADGETIPLADVVGVEARRGVPLLTRPRFVVRYRDEGGVKHRRIDCPSPLYGFDSFERGRTLFEREGVLVTEAVVDDTASGRRPE